MAPQRHAPTDAVVYANWVRVGSSPFEIAIDLGYREDDNPPQEYPVRVLMTWEHAKSFQLLLASAIESYEQEAGPIRDFEPEIASARPVAGLTESDADPEKD